MASRRFGTPVERGGLAVAALMIVVAVMTIAGANRRSLAPLADEDDVITYSIAPPTPNAASRDGDDELAAWAFDDWARASNGRLRFRRTDDDAALIRITWASGGGPHGAMRPILINGRRGAAVYVHPDTNALGPSLRARADADDLFRDTVVFLTCVHEIGHAIGLSHTSNDDDIMFSFGYGGDIPSFFGRYRDRIADRSDIASVSGVSAGDIERLRALYP